MHKDPKEWQAEAVRVPAAALRRRGPAVPDSRGPAEAQDVLRALQPRQEELHRPVLRLPRYKGDDHPHGVALRLGVRRTKVLEGREGVPRSLAFQSHSLPHRTQDEMIFVENFYLVKVRNGLLSFKMTSVHCK